MEEIYVSCSCKNCVYCVTLQVGFSCIFSDTDDCDPNPCVNKGTCIDGVNNYTCACHPGYEGTNCAISKCLILWEKKNSFECVCLTKTLCLDGFR